MASSYVSPYIDPPNLRSMVMDCDNLIGVTNVQRIFDGFTEPFILLILLYFSFLKNFSVGSPGSVLFRSSSLSKKKSLPSYPISLERDYYSASLPSVCFSFLISLLSYIAVSTGREDAIEIISLVLVDDVWTSTSHYVTILKLRLEYAVIFD